MSKVVLTYGTFDLFHVGHLSILNRLSDLGDRLVVGVSTDEFNAEKGKRTVVRFEDRISIVRSIRCVDAAFPERNWAQKLADIRTYDVSVLGMGDDWTGRFDDLRKHCEVLYLPRTESVSSTEMKQLLQILDRTHVEELKKALDIISAIVVRFD